MLPIREKEKEIKAALEENPVVIVSGETGSGKTTQLPQFCRELGYHKNGKIAVTQPRRIAATATAERVSEEIGCNLGSEVGYKIRFSRRVSEGTDTVFMTDGLLLQEIAADRMLSNYSVVIVDEAHERSLNIDFLLGFLRRLILRRRDLKIVISSATIDTELFSRAFDSAPVISVSGRMFPVEVVYDPPPDAETDYIAQALTAVDKISAEDDSGDILIFMPTERDIRELCAAVQHRYETSLVLPLFARLSKKDQSRIFTSQSRRKIIVSTNIAETSLTIPGIRYVVDSGLARINRYSPSLRTNRLPVERISKAEANQRKGRCGRVAGGICIRLYSEQEYENFSDFRPAEIRRSNLAGVILTLRNFNITDVEKFPFIETPQERAIQDAFSQLYELNALDKNKKLTAVGKKMARLPLEPHISRMMLQAQKENVAEEAAIICAGLSIVDPRERPRDKAEKADACHNKFLSPRSDFLTLLTLWETYHRVFEEKNSQNKMRAYCRDNFLNYKRMREWVDVYTQIRSILRGPKGKSSRGNFSSPRAFEDALHRSVLAGLVSSVAVYDDEQKQYRATRNRLVYMFPGSALVKKEKKPEWIMAQEIVQTSRVFARNIAPLDPRWVVEMFPHLLKKSYGPPFYDEEREVVLCEERRFFFGLMVEREKYRYYGAIDPEEARDIFIREALMEGRMNTMPPVFEKNLLLYESLREEEAKSRRRDIVIAPSQLESLYAERLGNVASARDIAGFLRKNGSDAVRLKKEDLCLDDIPENTAEFPRYFQVGSHSFPLSYAFEPGKAHDGITVRIPVQESAHLDKKSFGWIVKPRRPEKIEELLRQLPKAQRKQFVPLKESASRLNRILDVKNGDFVHALVTAIFREYGITLSSDAFDESALPDHLKLRISLEEGNEEVLATRDVEKLDSLIREKSGHSEGDILREIRARQVHNITSWSMGDIPQKEIISHSENGIPLFGYPALMPEKKNGDIVYTCFTDEKKAQRIHSRGVAALLERVLDREWRYAKKQIRLSSRGAFEAHAYGGKKTIIQAGRRIIREAAFFEPRSSIRTSREFSRLYEERKKLLRSGAGAFESHMDTLFTQLRKNRDLIEKLASKGSGAHREKRARELHEELDIYMEQFTDGFCPYIVWQHYPRYMAAFYYRIEKAFTAPGKYRRAAELLRSYQNDLAELIADFDDFGVQRRYDLLHLLFMVEELGVHLFAHPQIKCAVSPSEKTIENLMKECTKE
ncbi:MAG: ATP-dependent RNA helicase HrpA [Fibrobacterota bacterium]